MNKLNKIKQFTPKDYSDFINHTVIKIEHPVRADEGLVLYFDNGCVIDIEFSNEESTVEFFKREE